MNRSPSPNGSNGTAVKGRAASGRFAKGNPGGPGNPYARQVGKLRSALLAAVTEDDIRAIVDKLVELAKDGEIRAIREVFDRTFGRPVEADLIERIEQLEQALAEQGAA